MSILSLFEKQAIQHCLGDIFSKQEYELLLKSEVVEYCHRPNAGYHISISHPLVKKLKHDIYPTEQDNIRICAIENQHIVCLMVFVKNDILTLEGTAHSENMPDDFRMKDVVLELSKYPE